MIGKSEVKEKSFFGTYNGPFDWQVPMKAVTVVGDLLAQELKKDSHVFEPCLCEPWWTQLAIPPRIDSAVQSKRFFFQAVLCF